MALKIASYRYGAYSRFGYLLRAPYHSLEDTMPRTTPARRPRPLDDPYPETGPSLVAACLMVAEESAREVAEYAHLALEAHEHTYTYDWARCQLTVAEAGAIVDRLDAIILELLHAMDQSRPLVDPLHRKRGTA
jgi:hypothetical protein